MKEQCDDMYVGTCVDDNAWRTMTYHNVLMTMRCWKIVVMTMLKKKYTKVLELKKCNNKLQLPRCAQQGCAKKHQFDGGSGSTLCCKHRSCSGSIGPKAMARQQDDAISQVTVDIDCCLVPGCNHATTNTV